MFATDNSIGWQQLDGCRQDWKGGPMVLTQTAPGSDSETLTPELKRFLRAIAKLIADEIEAESSK